MKSALLPFPFPRDAGNIDPCSVCVIGFEKMHLLELLAEGGMLHCCELLRSFSNTIMRFLLRKLFNEVCIVTGPLLQGRARGDLRRHDFFRDPWALLVGLQKDRLNEVLEDLDDKRGGTAAILEGICLKDMRSKGTKGSRKWSS